MTFKATKLSNGFHILTYEMPGAQSVAINLIAKVGSRYEAEHESGISHFLEHMAFKGTKNRTAKQIAEEFDAIGGQFNAYTSREQTVYYAKVLPENTYTATSIIADIIQNSLFTTEDIAKEYNVICQEIAATLDSPDDLAFEKLSEVAFENQPIGRSILGTTETIAKFGTKDLQNYVAKHYHADNMFLSAAGKVDHDDMVKIAEELFAFTKGRDAEFAEAKYVGGVSLISKELEQSNILIGFESLSYLEVEAYYHTQILSLILGGGISSRLFQHIREDLGLAYSVGAFNSSYSDTGMFGVYAGTSHENLPKAAAALCDEINKIRVSVTEEELERAKAQIRASIVMAEEKSSYKSEEIGKHFSIFGRYDGPEVILDYVNRTTKEDILAAARNVFKGKPSLSVVGADASSVSYEDIVKRLG
jgi:predicted Zn-dependent peptidase